MAKHFHPVTAGVQPAGDVDHHRAGMRRKPVSYTHLSAAFRAAVALIPAISLGVNFDLPLWRQNHFISGVI